jgi:hypothetical protein
MSQTAILSGMYDELREYAELLDQVLMELKERSSEHSEAQKKLGRFLAEVASARTPSLTARLIGALMRREGHTAPDELGRIGARLNSQGSEEIDPAAISKLEELARSLEQEQAVATARMRGKEL